MNNHPLIGRCVELVEMIDDPDPIPYGARGTVMRVVRFLETEVITVNWEIKRCLNLVSPPDKYVIID